MTSDVKMQNLLDDVTEAVIAGENVQRIRRKHGYEKAESDELIELIERINQSMTKVQPSTQFAKQLKADLIDEKRMGMVWRIRKLPARVQYAAVVAIVTGFMLIVRRIFLGDDGTIHEETNPAQDKI